MMWLLQDAPRSIRQDSKNDQRVVLLSVLCEWFLFVVGLIFVSSFVVVVSGDIFNSLCLAVLSLGVYSLELQYLHCILCFITSTCSFSLNFCGKQFFKFNLKHFSNISYVFYLAEQPCA